MHRGPLVFLNACILYLTASPLSGEALSISPPTARMQITARARARLGFMRRGCRIARGAVPRTLQLRGISSFSVAGTLGTSATLVRFPTLAGRGICITGTAMKQTASMRGVQTGCIYYGVDLTWFTGASWVRPILNADNVPSTSLVASCAHQIAGGVSQQSIDYSWYSIYS